MVAMVAHARKEMQNGNASSTSMTTEFIDDDLLRNDGRK